MSSRPNQLFRRLCSQHSFLQRSPRRRWSSLIRQLWLQVPRYRLLYPLPLRLKSSQLKQLRFELKCSSNSPNLFTVNPCSMFKQSICRVIDRLPPRLRLNLHPLSHSISRQITQLYQVTSAARPQQQIWRVILHLLSSYQRSQLWPSANNTLYRSLIHIISRLRQHILDSVKEVIQRSIFKRELIECRRASCDYLRTQKLSKWAHSLDHPVVKSWSQFLSLQGESTKVRLSALL